MGAIRVFAIFASRSPVVLKNAFIIPVSQGQLARKKLLNDLIAFFHTRDQDR